MNSKNKTKIIKNFVNCISHRGREHLPKYILLTGLCGLPITCPIHSFIRACKLYKTRLTTINSIAIAKQILKQQGMDISPESLLLARLI